VAGKVDPVFVDDVADLPAAIAAHARAGDVVITMGAGSIGACRRKVELLLGDGMMKHDASNRQALGKVAVLMGGSSAERARSR
jgi:hypothetical protein